MLLLLLPAPSPLPTLATARSKRETRLVLSSDSYALDLILAGYTMYDAMDDVSFIGYQAVSLCCFVDTLHIRENHFSRTFFPLFGT